MKKQQLNISVIENREMYPNEICIYAAFNSFRFIQMIKVILKFASLNIGG